MRRGGGGVLAEPLIRRLIGSPLMRSSPLTGGDFCAPPRCDAYAASGALIICMPASTYVRIFPVHIIQHARANTHKHTHLYGPDAVGLGMDPLVPLGVPAPEVDLDLRQTDHTMVGYIDR